MAENSSVDVKKISWELLRLMFGTTLMAAAVVIIFDPLGMVPGGISGLAITLKKVCERWLSFSLPVGAGNFLLNIPIFIWAFFVKGKDFVFKTLFANTWFSFMMMVIPVVQMPEQDYFLAAMLGGVFTGTGLGIVFSTGYSTGGTDMLGTLLWRYFPYMSVSTILFILDSLVILTGIILFGIRIGCYAAASVFISSRIMDNILAMGRSGKQALIVSKKYKEIGNQIMEKLHRGVTQIQAKGMFSGEDRPILLCAVDRKQVIKLTQLVKNLDEHAFVIVSETKEVMGEGFRHMTQ